MSAPDVLSPQYALYVTLLAVGTLIGGTGASFAGGPDSSAIDLRVERLEADATKVEDTLSKVRDNQLLICDALKVDCRR